MPRQHIAGVFHDEAITGIEEEPGAEIEPLLRAVDDDDLLRRATDPAGPPQIALQGRPQ